ncbi:DUF4184 family protein [Nibribacter ruber]|uniref:DUF4184 family protein n=1 Tax=Nibribacter ruber TaxID=2698458 RepID=A0A6P1NYP0_9BACT|nr:DUF4184 family protein [Nibribacter ruber]QHL87155.1 DUF4184 family protein [Nibribacter ruber]
MPFTFAHPAILLPWRNWSGRWVSWTGLILGSMSPDFEYFLRMRVESNYSHTLSGLLWFNLPLPFILAVLFHILIRNPTIDHLPHGLGERLNSYKDFQFVHYLKKHWHIFALSVVMGSFSHLAWDAFTHQQGFFVERLPVLQYHFSFRGFHFPVYKVLQHLSTVVGFVCIGYFTWKMPTKPVEPSFRKFRFWVSIAVLMTAILVIRLLTGLALEQTGHWIATGISGGCIALLVTCLFAKDKPSQST